LAGAEVLSIAHRGNSMSAPENTLAAFRAAEGKADLVETDIRVSSDGVLVLMHDVTVTRTTDGTGNVSAMTLTQLKGLDAGSWFAPEFAGERVPTLEEMLATTLPFATPLLEHKAGSAASYVTELRRLGVLTNVIVQSFDWDFLAAMHALEPLIPLCGLGSGALDVADLDRIEAAGARTVAWEKGGVTAVEVAMVHDRGLQFFVWTVDSPQEIARFVSLGIDGVISNDPASVKNPGTITTNAPTHWSDRLIAHWTFDDGLADPAARVVTDAWGANPGTLVQSDPASHWVGEGVARIGGGLDLEGASAHVVVPSTKALDIGTNAVTLSGWVWLPGLPSRLPAAYGAIYDSTTDCYVLYLDRSNRELRFKVTDVNGHAARPGIPEAALRTNEWLHVAATYSGQGTVAAGRAAIYLDGVLQDVHTGHDASSPVGLTGNVKTGQAAAMGREGPTGGNAFTGMVDDLALWGRALSGEEIRQLFEAGRNGLGLADLLKLPTPLLVPGSIRPDAAGMNLEITFENLGPWQTFRLAQADSCAGPFEVVPGLAPIALGEGRYQFVWPLDGSSMRFFLIQAE